MPWKKEEEGTENKKGGIDDKTFRLNVPSEIHVSEQNHAWQKQLRDKCLCSTHVLSGIRNEESP